MELKLKFKIFLYSIQGGLLSPLFISSSFLFVLPLPISTPISPSPLRTITVPLNSKLQVRIGRLTRRSQVTLPPDPALTRAFGFGGDSENAAEAAGTSLG